MLKHYGLRKQPFGATPDPSFLYMSPSHREAFASLLYAIESGRGFNALICAPGMGKTTLLFRLLEELRGRATTSFVFQTQIKPRELLRLVLNDFGIPSRGTDFIQMNESFNKFLLAEAKAGRQCVIVVDEAQNLSDDTLESVRLLSDFETANKKLLHIILAGQPTLAQKLSNPNLLQLKQRVGMVCRIAPLSSFEVSEYINHRLTVAGRDGGNIFTPEAMAILGKHSEGVPRNINALCFGAMSIAFAMNQSIIDEAIVAEAIADLQVDKAGLFEWPLQPGDLASSAGNDVVPAASTLPSAATALATAPRIAAGAVDSQIHARAEGLELKVSPSPREQKTPIGKPKAFATQLVPLDLQRVKAKSSGSQQLKMLRQRLKSRAIVALAVAAVCLAAGLFVFFSDWDLGPGVIQAKTVETGNSAVARNGEGQPNGTEPQSSAVEEQNKVVTNKNELPVTTASSLRAPTQTQRPELLPASDEAAEPSASGIAESSESQGKRLGQILGASNPLLPTLNIGVAEPSTTEDSDSTSPLKMVEPRYPSWAKKLGIEGTVVLRARVAKNGRVLRIDTISGNPQLVPAARDAVKDWVYPPTTTNGKRIEVERQVQLHFSLTGGGVASNK